MNKLLMLAPCTALLFACSGGGGASGGAVALQPGQWETTMQFNNIEAPGVPEQQLAAMRQAMSQPRTMSQCITAQQAANPMGNMMGQQQQGCNFTKNTFAGGTIDISGTCSPGGQQAQMTMTGNYTANSMNAQISTSVRPPAGTPGPQEVRMSGTLSARRTGDCPAGGTAPAGNTM